MHRLYDSFMTVFDKTVQKTENLSKLKTITKLAIFRVKIGNSAAVLYTYLKILLSP